MKHSITKDHYFEQTNKNFIKTKGKHEYQNPYRHT
jgi:hypothetical protein